MARSNELAPSARNDNSDSRLQTALDFAARGFKIFPQSREKRPLLQGWPTNATDDPKIIESWFKKYPKANFAFVTGKPSDCIVLDVDVKNGQKGEDSLKRLEEDHGKIDTTLIVRTPSGGSHHYFNYPPDLNGVKNVPQLASYSGLEIKGDNGCITLPGSIYKNGMKYIMERDGPIAPCPEWLKKLLQRTRSVNHKANTGERPRPRIIRDGERNDALASLAGALRARGASYQTMLASLTVYNQQSEHPETPDVVERTARSYTRYEADTVPLYHLTDLGNAERLVDLFGHRIRYCDIWKTWLIWDGTRWKRDSDRAIYRLAKKTVKEMYREAADIDDEQMRKITIDYTRKCEAAPKIRAMIEMASSEAKVAVTPDMFDRDPWLLNVQNGTLDLKSGEFREHQQSDMLAKICPVDFDWEAECPGWLTFLHQIMNGDKEMIGFLQRAAGYSLTGIITEQCFFVAYGRGSNGKSTFLGLLHRILGDYSVRVPIELILAKRPDNFYADVAMLAGTRFASAVEAPKNHALNEERLKNLTGENVAVARRLYKNFSDFEVTFKLWFAVNHLPVVRDRTKAFWRRCRLIPFTFTVTSEQQDPNLGETLWCERSGILNWLIRKVQTWQERGLDVPEPVHRATAAYRDESDMLVQFISDELEIGKDREIQSSKLHERYKSWAQANGEPLMSQIQLTREMDERGYHKELRRNIAFWLGIGARAPEVTPPVENGEIR